jgi:hypothetical protein
MGTQKVTFEQYKIEFLAYASSRYSLGAPNDWSDEEIMLGYTAGDSPVELMEWYAEKYNLTKLEDMTLAEAEGILKQFQK